ncbi:MAG: hypothetical protein NVSMB70_02670 [Chamaesiphon sp.]
MSSKRKPFDPNPSDRDRIVYREFGDTTNPAAVERSIPELPPVQQNLRVQASRKGRKGKTVTVVSGFQLVPETLEALLKQLKAQCGAGGTIKDNEIEIQGDHTQKMVQILTQLGYKAKISGG